ncbi:hypothetical protein C8N46_102485 [Kordia periserrulae]|uniref:DUF3078 domain-containing protein n=1 Tax=Kordia periserrulae TaxID=701523 RepID=A0A2T6C453_9FLAO|nr:hypothetical protein [Kordia periserrulae]PTX63082.1 hypothetical protein C8N46_102485 [Kordia periserrulae]
MKSLILSILLFILASNVYSQTQTEYEEVAKNNQINYVPSDIDSLRKNTFDKYLEDMNKLNPNPTPKKDSVFYNNVVLNKYFANKITNYAISTDDLSFTDYIVNANTSNKTLTIGGSFRLDNFKKEKGKRKAARQLESLRKVGNLLTLYVRSDLSDGFSNLYSENSDTQEYNFNSSIGIGGKYTRIYNGTIKTDKRAQIDIIRSKYIQKEIEKAIADYDADAFTKELELEKLRNPNDNESDLESKLVRKKHREFYEAIVDKELTYAKEYNLIKSSHMFWYSLEFFMPLSRKIITSSTDNLTTQDNKFTNWNTTLQMNYLYNRNNACFIKDFSIKGTAQFAVFNTNDFIANNDSAVTFQNIIQDNMSSQVEGSSSSVFLGNYNDFPAGSVKGEVSSLFFNNTVGLSVAFEQTIGEIHNRNWKLGIPISFKDKDGKPTLNFELQWREINTQHSVGISVGYNFGKFVQ